MTYPVNEMFLSIQGEGRRVGTLNVFVRFAGCNQTCRVETHGFDCDTEFVSKGDMTADEIVGNIYRLWGAKSKCRPSVILTGGEPGLHVDSELCSRLSAEKMFVAVETNGSIAWDEMVVDWICVSPKVAEHAIRQTVADEIRYVRGDGQGIPKPACKADHKFLSPAFDGDVLNPGALATCLTLIRANPDWLLSIQQHKLLQIR